MQMITIDAATPDSAAGLYEALSGFRVDLRETNEGRRYVEVELAGKRSREIVDVLNAVEDYVTHRGAGSTRLVLDGRNYTLHAR